MFDIGMINCALKFCDHYYVHECLGKCESSKKYCSKCERNVAAGRPCT